jgi:hypothetical protein
MGLGLVVILGISGGVNGVDQIRLDVAFRLSVRVGWSGAYFHVVLDLFFPPPIPLGLLRQMPDTPAQVGR